MTENDKREKIIQAAYAVLSEKGYDQASTKEIARVAGVAQGLISYYFPSKDLLFAEVFRRETEKYCASIPYIESQGKEALTIDNIRSILRVPQARANEQPSSIKLRYELFALGLRNQAVADNIKETLARKREHLVRLIRSVSQLPEEQAASLAPILMSVFDGLALQRLSDEQFDIEGAYDTLATMLEAYLNKLNRS